MKRSSLILLFATSAMLAASTTLALITDYTYDAAGRLVRADYSNGGRIDYVYDANGNLIQRITTGGGDVIYTLIYRAGAGGRIDGVATQLVNAGESGTAVSAVVEDAAAAFGRWSDGRTEPVRTEINVQAHRTVYAQFRSIDGADLDWYAARGIAPNPGETWTDVDARAVAGKGTTLRHENIADLNPNDTNSLFRILRIAPGPHMIVHFEPGSTGRVYSLQFTDNLTDDVWTNVPGAGPRMGVGGPDTMTDTNEPPAGNIYRIGVQLP